MQRHHMARHAGPPAVRVHIYSSACPQLQPPGLLLLVPLLCAQGKRDVLERLLSETVDGLNPHRLALNNGHSDFARQLEPFLQPQGRVRPTDLAPARSPSLARRSHGVCMPSQPGGGASSSGLSLDLPAPPPPPTASAERSHEAMASGSERPSPMPPAPPPTEQTAASGRSAGGQPQQK